MPGLPDILAGLEATHEIPVFVEQSPIHSVDCWPSIVASGLGIGNPTSQRLGRHFDQEVVACLLIYEQQQLFGEIFEVNRPSQQVCNPTPALRSWL